MSACEAEMCRNWTGQGCACEFLGMEPDVVEDQQREERDAEVCDGCGRPAVWWLCRCGGPC